MRLFPHYGRLSRLFGPRLVHILCSSWSPRSASRLDPPLVRTPKGAFPRRLARLLPHKFLRDGKEAFGTCADQDLWGFHGASSLLAPSRRRRLLGSPQRSFEAYTRVTVLAYRDSVSIRYLPAALCKFRMLSTTQPSRTGRTRVGPRSQALFTPIPTVRLSDPTEEQDATHHVREGALE